MRKKYLNFLLAILLPFFVCSNAYSLLWADLDYLSPWTPDSGWDYTGASDLALATGLGEYIGSVDYNGSVGEGTLEAFFLSGGYTVETLVDGSGITVKTTQEKPGEETGDDPDGIAGWWSVDTVSSAEVQNYVNFIVVKGATGFSVHEYSSALAGLWNIAYLPLNSGGQNPGMSFVRGYVGDGAPVPEPATMLLLGTGLIGIAAVSRKKLLKKS